MKIETYLPIFSGFYNTQWKFDDNYVEDFINEDRKELHLYSEADFNNLKIDYSSYELDVVELFCKALPEFMEDFIVSIELQKIVSPKKYNFENDSANVIIDTKTENITKFIYENKAKFCEFLKSRYKSYDGFISHYNYDFESWESDTKGFSDFSIDGHRLGAILDFIAIMLKIDNYTVFEIIFDDIDFLSYVENLGDITNQNDGSLFEFLTSKGIEKSFAVYIEASYNNGIIKELVLSEKILSIVHEFENSLVEA